MSTPTAVSSAIPATSRMTPRIELKIHESPLPTSDITPRMTSNGGTTMVETKL